MRESPQAWQRSALGDIAGIAIGGTPSRDIPRYWATNGDDGYPWVAISDLRSRVITKTEEQITASGVANSNVKPVKQGTVLMSFKLSLGRVACAGCDLYTNEAIAAFIGNDTISPRFLYYCLPDAVRMAATDVAIKGATLNKRSLRKLKISYPERKKQEKIASILSCVDDAIERTETLIAKYQHIKAGLMHDLFTRGVLPNGQLRPPREQAPELYRETAIGWIPADWTMSVLRACLTDSPTNGKYLPPAQIGEGTLLIGQTAFTLERSIDFSLCRRGRVGSVDLERYGIARDDILVTRVFATAQGVGLPTLVPDLPEDAVFESNMMRLRIDGAVIKSQLLFEWLRTSSLRRRIESGVNASNQASVNQKVLNSLPVVLPNADEQDRILAKIKSIDKVHTAECAALSKLQNQKFGLMQDLLTGKVQVGVLEPTEIAMHA